MSKRACGRVKCFVIAAILATLISSPALCQQQPPQVGYVFPPGGEAGKTVNVSLGGYDWTPDMQFFLDDKRVKLEIVSALGPMKVPPGPYWFGPKARGPALLIPREFQARLTIPSGMNGKVIRWHAANANGATTTGQFVVNSSHELVEHESRKAPMALSKLPVTINGRLKKLEEVDRYHIKIQKAGPVTCQVFARRIGSPINAVIRVHDATGRLVQDAVDTQGVDINLTFFAKANHRYTLSLHDMDF
jgi:hypothetical protein